MARRRVAFRKRRQNRLAVTLIGVIVIMLVVVIFVGIISLKGKNEEYDKREATLREQIAQEEKRSQELVEYEKYTKTAKYVEEIAKEKLGLVYEDEIIFQEDKE